MKSRQRQPTYLLTKIMILDTKSNKSKKEKIELIQLYGKLILYYNNDNDIKIRPKKR